MNPNRSLTILAATALLMILAASCTGSKTKLNVVEFGPDSPRQARIEAPEEPEAEDLPGAADSTAPVKGLKWNPIGRLDDAFNDSNYVHLAEATEIGIEPLSTTRSFWRIRRPLVKIATCGDFVVDELTHSRPYLVPEAAEMVHEIGRRFRDSVSSRGGGDYRVRVTSVLRTPEGVRRLRRVNRNAVDTSVHQMGTTVDITYAGFAAAEGTVPHRTEELKAILAEVLLAMRSEGKIFVKYEKHQPCFHITARNRADK